MLIQVRSNKKQRQNVFLALANELKNYFKEGAKPPSIYTIKQATHMSSIVFYLSREAS